MVFYNLRLTRPPPPAAIYRSAYSPDKLLETLPRANTLHDVLAAGLKAAGANAPYLGHRPILGYAKVPGQDTPKPVWGEYVWQSYATVSDRSKAIGAGLRRIYATVEPESINAKWHAGIYSVNRPEWLITDFAIHAHSLVSVALYDTLGASAAEFVINHSEVPLIVCSLDKVQRLLEIAPKTPGLKVIVSMDPFETLARSQFPASGQILKQWAAEKGILLVTLAEVEALGRKQPLEPRLPTPEDIAAIVFTSGTTGNPKGAIITHRNIVSGYAGMEKQGCTFAPGDAHISYLPLAHCYERLIAVGATYGGGQIGFFRGEVPLLFEDIALLKPTMFASVPRLLNRLADAILLKTVKAGGVKGILFSQAFSAKLQGLKNGTLTHSVWDNTLLKPIRVLLGGRVRFMATGAAPISPEVINLLKICFSCNVLEGFGQTETCAATSATLFDDHRAIGKTGPILANTEVKLVDIPEMDYRSTDKPDPRGEIWLRGPTIFKGYYKDEKKTAEALTEDGWLKTGDVGLFDANGRIKIIDRRKNIFKLAQGEYVAPEKLEVIFSANGTLAQLYVHGDSLQTTLVLVAVPAPESAVKAAIEANILPADTPVPGPPAEGEPAPEIVRQLCKDPRFIKLALDGIVKIGKANKLAGYEIPKKLHLEPEPWTVDDGMLTPTFKVKREIAKNRYRPQIDAMYAEINAEAAPVSKL
ncbi:hypothetical protein BDK51DRAFT_21855 [Blyttiomyces helicus]|uniref:AMP-dependent synthetase/ligase domain-containing protein n=1 Tax=Blyttiomyces helicus TaxID=388810 RepID=A0A4P9WN12_9FUNG|nr:hypothetical protein BDK51DRAFT_21855 [Blyttiomyces helicus]|eukprot:RKO93635.1 hypothetical protein BDK51DRAFT_21855 [Blyttiomyces helicus]